MVLGPVMTAVRVVGSVLFIIGSGSYFGTRFKTATAAIAATLGSYLVLRFLFCGMFNPLSIILYRTITPGRTNVFYMMSFVMSILPSLALAGLGIFLERRAIRRLRRNIF